MPAGAQLVPAPVTWVRLEHQRKAAPHQLRKAPLCQQKGLLLAGQHPLLAPLLLSGLEQGSCLCWQQQPLPQLSGAWAGALQPDLSQTLAAEAQQPAPDHKHRRQGTLVGALRCPATLRAAQQWPRLLYCSLAAVLPQACCAARHRRGWATGSPPAEERCRGRVSGLSIKNLLRFGRVARASTAKQLTHNRQHLLTQCQAGYLKDCGWPAAAAGAGLGARARVLAEGPWLPSPLFSSLPAPACCWQRAAMSAEGCKP